MREETALTLQGKNNRLSRKDFEALGHNLGLNQKVIVSLMDRILALPELTAKTGAVSLLPAKRQLELERLITERRTRLADLSEGWLFLLYRKKYSTKYLSFGIISGI